MRSFEKINFIKISSDEIEALKEEELREVLAAHRVDVLQFSDKKEFINQALHL